MKQPNTVYPIERIISAASYLTAGLAGFIWLVIAALLKKSIRSFLMFNIIQSLFLSFAYVIFLELYKVTYIAFAKIPVINSIIFLINGFLYSPIQIFWGLSFLQIFTSAVIIYLTGASLLGIYGYIPYVSNIIKANTGNQ